MPTATTSDGNAPAACEVSVNINAADVEDLKTLPGIGDVLAQRIVDYRNLHGGFASVEELEDIKGIGEKTLVKVAPCVVLR